MPKIEINKERCKGCQLCVLYCPKGCIKLDECVNSKGVHPVLFLDKDKKCIACSFCALVCPDVCVEIHE